MPLLGIPDINDNKSNFRKSSQQIGYGEILKK